MQEDGIHLQSLGVQCELVTQILFVVSGREVTCSDVNSSQPRGRRGELCWEAARRFFVSGNWKLKWGIWYLMEEILPSITIFPHL